ncbi:MAG TPA: tRNA preQ1(34) S-adenosylmethionine ribosyltransferase-isomerase QueA [Rhizomicrobium sp.]|jgi:S-adenosylmethionine:tRNA ribosyltransferase-isomerase|nr:tRNA preQ1(34) S-adenosylmethionine ribosyltransferase-isomerase QueA [Rhizomicrobium sp.]
MRVDRFDFHLPEELIALRPARPRDSARMLVVGADGSLCHAQVRELSNFLRAGDAMVLNDTKVIRARLRGRRSARRQTDPDARVEVTLHKRLGGDRYLAFARPARKLEAGDRLDLGRTIAADVLARGEGGEVDLRFSLGGTALDMAIAQEGEMPLPPYIAGKRSPDARDDDDYQTAFAREEGSVAAPTAGLHFTPALLADLETKGVTRECVTLHVGAGTFLPVSADDTERHRMHSEWARLTGAAAARLNSTREAGGRIVAVGTTTVRTLESAADERGILREFAGETDIFITPGYRFRTAEVLLTNFHLPRSTLFMLVAAFCGEDRIRAAYAEAISRRYRFYSYGDACLLFRPS